MQGKSKRVSKLGVNLTAVSSRGGSLCCYLFSDFVWCCSNQEPWLGLFHSNSCTAVCIACHLGLWKTILKVTQFLCMNSDVGIMFVNCAACIHSPSLLMPSGLYGLLGTGAFALVTTHLWLVPYSEWKYMDRPRSWFTESYSCLRTAGSHHGSNPLCGGITFAANYVTWFSFKHIQNKSVTRQTFNSGLVSRTVMGDSSQHLI